MNKQLIDSPLHNAIANKATLRINNRNARHAQLIVLVVLEPQKIAPLVNQIG